MHTFVSTRRVGQEVEHLPRIRPTSTQFRVRLAVAVCPVRVDKHAIAGTSISIACAPLTAFPAQRALGIVQVDVGGLEGMVVDLVEVVDSPDEVGANVALLIERLEAAPHAHILVGLVLRVTVLDLVGIDPLLDIDGARAVVDLVRNVGRLRVDGADLADDGHLRDGVAVDGEIRAGVRLFEIVQLFDGYGTERLVCIALHGGEKERLVLLRNPKNAYNQSLDMDGCILATFCPP